MTARIGIDIGGTRLKAGLVDPQGRVSHTTVHWLQPQEKHPRALIAKLAEVIDSLSEFTRPDSVGVGIPGIVHWPEGTLKRSPNFPHLVDFAVRHQLAARVQLPVSVDNDANCVLAGEHLAGAARGVQSFIGLTLGTGVGGAIMLNGELWRGVNGMGAELGHVIVDPMGPLCASTGTRGPLEMYPSVVGLRAMCAAHPVAGVETESPELPQQLAERAAAGDPLARKHFSRAGQALGQALGGFLNLFDVKLVVLAGGVAAAFPWMEETTWAALRAVAYPEIAEGVTIRQGELHEHAGVIGAAMLSGPPGPHPAPQTATG